MLILITYLQQHAFGPAGSPKSAGMILTGPSCESFLFLRPKALQLEAAVCQSSTAKC